MRAIYAQQIGHLREAMQRFWRATRCRSHVRACYPFVRIHTDTVARLSLGSRPAELWLCTGPGRYETTLTRPDLYGDYYLEQFGLLRNHGVELEVGTSTHPIPVHFRFAEHDHIEGTLDAQRRLLMRDVFDLPTWSAMDDGIANGTWEPAPVMPAVEPVHGRAGWTIHCTGCATTPARRRTGSRTSCCSPATSSTLTGSCGWDTRSHAQTRQRIHVASSEPGNVVTRRTGLPAERPTRSTAAATPAANAGLPPDAEPTAAASPW